MPLFRRFSPAARRWRCDPDAIRDFPPKTVLSEGYDPEGHASDHVKPPDGWDR